MKVLVLGSGPAGLIAAHTAVMMDHDVLIYSKGTKSDLYGCQYLHAPIPYATVGEPVVVRYILEGTPEGYAGRVYGRTPFKPAEVSPQTLGDEHLAWDIRQTYDRLWEMYGRYVQEQDLSPATALGLAETLDPDLIVSSIPANLLCRRPGEHHFGAEEVWAMGDAPALGQEVPMEAEENSVRCNGLPVGVGPAWYRLANVFGHKTVEWPGYIKKPPLPGTARVKKPLVANCDCEQLLPTPTLKVGRYGKWKKGVLSHEAQIEVAACIRSGLLGQQGVLW